MQFKFFRIRPDAIDQSQDELNKFLRSCRVLNVHRDFDSVTGTWCYAVEYLEDQTIASKANTKVDYRDKLNDVEFARFRVLRECRKALAAETNLPPYVIFIDEQLAALSKFESISIETIKSIKGIGEQKTQKYGDRFLNIFESKKSDLEKYLAESSDEKAR